MLASSWQGHSSCYPWFFLAWETSKTGEEWIHHFDPKNLQSSYYTIGLQAHLLTNELYKIIARIISRRLKGVMAKLISSNQSAFIPGRSITDNILLCHDLMRSSHLQAGPPRMFLKIDLSKAFDSARWDFIKFPLENMNFSSTVIN